MAIITATECTVYSNITASAATITASGLIPIVQERITLMTNNYFLTDLYLQDAVTFNAAAGTIIADTGDYDSVNFLADDDIMVYNSYRNDGYFTLDTVSGSTLTIVSTGTVVDELSGASVLITVVRWPVAVKHVAALMVAYDYDIRPKKSGNVKSHSLGPFSETFTSGAEDELGYPRKITDALIPYRMARLM
jgi:hypothetical protein